MKRLLLGTTALVLALAAVTLAEKHDTPPPDVLTLTNPAAITALPVIVSTPDVGYVAELSVAKLVTPIPADVPANGSDGIWLERSTRAVPALRHPAPATQYRLRIDSNDIEALPSMGYHAGAFDINGGRGFL